MKIKNNDNVLILKGKDRGKVSRVQKLIQKNNTVLLEGVNLVSRHTKASNTVRQAGIIQKEMPISASNLALICPNCEKKSRISIKANPDKTKSRICKKCNQVIN